MTDKTAIARVADEEIEGVPGLTLHSVDMIGPTSILPGSSVETANVCVDGWGPTFHARRRDWRVSIRDAERHAGDGSTAVQRGRFDDSIRQQLQARLTHQRRLRRAAAALGIMAPIPIPTTVGMADFGHILVPSIAIETMIAMTGHEGAYDAITKMITSILRSTEGNETQIIAGNLALVSFFYEQSRLTPTVQIDTTRGVTLSGAHFTIRGTMPDTLLTAAVGRPLKDIVSTGIAPLDNAIISNAFNGEVDANFALESRTLRVLELLDRGPFASSRSSERD